MKIPNTYSKNKVIIGKNVSIAPNVMCICEANANNGKEINSYSYVANRATCNADIYIEDEVWIGANVTILPGVTLGKGSIIGAGSVVIKDVDSYGVYAGVPAKKFGILEKRVKSHMDNKEKYEIFCQKTYVPIYSKPWWLNAICGKENWDVWLYEKGTDIWAAMPYYIEKRKDYRYITKAPLTQNNGIIFKYPREIKAITKQSFEENVINDACEYINKIKVDVYEQQYHYSFNNWLPFYWNRYEEITRYTYVIEDTNDLEKVWNSVSSNYRNKIRKGQKNGIFCRKMNYELFYDEHKKYLRNKGCNVHFL